jgi:hypothetical protein
MAAPTSLLSELASDWRAIVMVPSAYVAQELIRLPPVFREI